MDATAELTGTPTCEDYKSRPGALIWFFRKSRDRWKSKHQDLKATVKGFKNHIADVTKSREQWSLKAEQASERVSALETEVNDCVPRQRRRWIKKNGPGKRPAEAQPG